MIEQNKFEFYLLIPILIILFGQSLVFSSSDAINLHLERFGQRGLICRSDSKKTVVIQAKVLSQSTHGMTQVYGRIITVNQPGVFLIFCYVNQDETVWIKEIYKFTLDRKLHKYQKKITEKSLDRTKEVFSTVRVKVEHSILNEKKGIHLVSCSSSYPYRHEEELQLIRIRPDGQRIQIKMNVRKLSSSLSVHNHLLTMTYKHKFLYSLEYFQNKFECRTVQKFTQLCKSVSTEPIIAESRCGRNLFMNFTENWHLQPNLYKIIRPFETIGECSCRGAYPEPEIFWIDAVGKKIKGAKLKRNRIINLPNFYCCVASQTFKSGEKHKESVCWSKGVSIQDSCQKVKVLNPSSESGLYNLQVNKVSMKVFCDMKSLERAWIVIQRRINGSVDFQKYWRNYKNGFGDLNGEFWLGNENLHQLTRAGSMKIRFDLWNKDDTHRYAEYAQFSVGPESDNYRLSISGYSGNAGNSMALHNNRKFSTKDRDNDPRPKTNCSLSSGHSGWWFNYCHPVNLNGQYLQPGTPHWTGIIWFPQHGNRSLKKTIIKIAYN